MPKTKDTALQRFLKRVAPDAEGACWEWHGQIDADGYGRLSVDGTSTLAHRFAYGEFVGDVPQGKQLDHICRNRRCVNPQHLEPVTSKVNTLRGESFAAMNAQKTHCPQGHPYDEGNTYPIPGGGRACRACKRATWGRLREQRQAQKTKTTA